ncbi:hypothetical protein [Klebsiella aerogenes]|uniref:hypothetical protein n=1 Tax=Klebsiella aerogenes TaxID=548 RepID=UPI001C7EA815|nr:hypothetical protein [Klebsiella aerogenes]HBQ0463700.1 hypothetical protein [Klebsiella aerogenes]HCB3013579.1 hypothetical protein [Klebsiella aerogenes]
MEQNTAAVTHNKIQVVLTIENGQVIDTRNVRDNELIASMDTFFWMAKKAGYQVIAPDSEVGRADSHTHS